MTDEVKRQKEELEKKLNQQQKKFCLAYIESYNATEAAKAAGYSKKTARQQGSRLLSNVNITAYTRVLQIIAVEKSGLSPDFITQKRLEILDRCMGGTPVKKWDYDKHEFVENGLYEFDAKNALKALEALDLTVQGVEDAGKNDILIKFESQKGKEWGG